MAENSYSNLMLVLVRYRMVAAVALFLSIGYFVASRLVSPTEQLKHHVQKSLASGHLDLENADLALFTALHSSVSGSLETNVDCGPVACSVEHRKDFGLGENVEGELVVYVQVLFNATNQQLDGSSPLQARIDWKPISWSWRYETRWSNKNRPRSSGGGDSSEIGQAPLISDSPALENYILALARATAGAPSATN
jgi:hypothetical protein